MGAICLQVIQITPWSYNFLIMLLGALNITFYLIFNILCESILRIQKNT